MQRYVFILCTVLSLLMAVPAGAQSTVSLSSSSGHPGDEVEVSVMLGNANSATALQIIIPHSPFLSYVTGSAKLNKQMVSESHSLSVSDDDNQLNLYVYDLSLNTLKDGTDAFITFRMKLGQEPGTYKLNPEVILSDASSKPLSVSSKAGEIIILSPKVSLSTTEIDYGSVAIRGKYTKEVSVSNIGNEALTLSEVKSESALFKVTPQTMTIAAGQKSILSIEYSPQNRGNDLTDITVVSNASNGNQTIHVTASPFSVNTFSVADVSGQSGEEVTVHVSMENMEPIVGVQSSFILPDALKYVDGSVALSGRSSGNSHLISGSVKDGKLSFFIHSSSNAALSGNEGELFTFKLLLNGTGGDYSLEPEDVVLSNVAGEDMTSGVNGATVRIAAPKMVCSSELDFGRIPIAETLKQKYTITNSGESPLVIQRIDFSDETFSLSEKTLPTIAAGKSTDIEVCYSPAEEGAFSGIMQIYSNDPQNPMQAVEIKGTTYAYNEIELNGKAVSGKEDQYELTVSLQNTLPVVGMQMDIRWIPGMELVKDAVSISSRASEHKADITKLTDDSYRIYIYSFSNDPIAPGNGPVFSIIYNKVEGQDSYDQTIIRADHVILSTADERNCASSPTATWTVGNISGLMGDANNDGAVNVQDMICISRYLLGDTGSSGIVESQADVDQDRVITTSDLIGVIHIIFNDNKQ